MQLGNWKSRGYLKTERFYWNREQINIWTMMFADPASFDCHPVSGCAQQCPQVYSDCFGTEHETLNLKSTLFRA